MSTSKASACEWKTTGASWWSALARSKTSDQHPSFAPGNRFTTTGLLGSPAAVPAKIRRSKRRPEEHGFLGRSRPALDGKRTLSTLELLTRDTATLYTDGTGKLIAVERLRHS